MTSPHATAPWTPRTGGEALTLADVGELEVLARILPHAHMAAADVGPGDDAAVLTQLGGRTVVTTDSMVADLDWRDDWSSAHDVGVKVIAQNIADVIAMGARPTGVVVAIACDGATRLDWLEELSDGMADELRRAGTGTLGGDLSGARDGSVVITVTALGDLAPGEEPLLRSRACPGDAVVISDRLGRSHAGLLLLSDGGQLPADTAARECLDFHRAPWPRYEAGQEAVAAGMRCAMDVSDGLGLDAARLARASRVCIDLDGGALGRMAQPLRSAVGSRAFECVMSGGEEHALLGTCPPSDVPRGWLVIGRVEALSDGDPGVSLDGVPLIPHGWSHYM